MNNNDILEKLGCTVINETDNTIIIAITSEFLDEYYDSLINEDDILWYQGGTLPIFEIKKGNIYRKLTVLNRKNKFNY